jgi:hypothetical protein
MAAPNPQELLRRPAPPSVGHAPPKRICAPHNLGIVLLGAQPDVLKCRRIIPLGSADGKKK